MDLTVFKEITFKIELDDARKIAMDQYFDKGEVRKGMDLADTYADDIDEITAEAAKDIKLALEAADFIVHMDTHDNRS